MNAFLGVLILDPLESQKTFNAVSKEIMHHLHLHQSEVKLMQSPHLISLQALHNTNTFSLPKQEAFVHTCHHLLSFSPNPTQAEIAYFRIILECLIILKEHFPSKIQIQLSVEDEHLQLRLERELEQSLQDLARRYVSQFRSLALRVDQITQQEVNDILYILRKEDSPKLVSMGLSILKKVSSGLFSNISEIETRALEQLSQQQQFQKPVTIILQKIKQSRNTLENKLQQSRQSTTTHRIKYDQPTILNSFTFQLKQSNNIERLSFLVEKISSQVFRLERENVFKVDNSVFNAIERLMNGNKLDDSKESVGFVENVLKYLVLRKNVGNWAVVIDLLNNALLHPELAEGIAGTFLVFLGEFRENCDDQILRELEGISRVLNNEYRQKPSKQSGKPTKQPKEKPREYDCMTSRSTMVRHRASTKSTYLK